MGGPESEVSIPNELLEHGADVLWRAGTDLRIQYVSPTVTPLLGWAPDELIGRPVTDLIDPAQRASLTAISVRPGESATFTGQVRRKDGSWMWFENRFVGVDDGDGALVGYAGVLRDIDAHVAAEQGRVASERRFRMLAEQSSDVVLQADLDGVILWITDSVEPLLDLAPSDLVGRRVFELIHPDDVPMALAMQERVNAGESTRYELRFLSRDGEPRWVSAVLRPVFDDDGTIIGRVSGWRSIDEERLVREQLRTSEEHLRFLIEHAADVMFQEVDGIPVYASPGLALLLGYEPDELVGRPVTEYWHPDDRAVVAELRREVHEGAMRRVVARMRNKAGEYRHIEVTARPAPHSDGRPGSVGVLRDVTDRVSAEDALAEVQERDRLMAELSSDVFGLFGADGTIEYIAGGTVELIGRTAEALIGTSGMALFPADELEPAQSRLELLQRGQVVSGLVRLLRADGGIRWVDRRSRALFHEDGSLRGFATSWRDAQAEMDYREALGASEREAKEANQAKTLFLSRMSHELRTPLNAVLGFAQLLEMDDLDDDQRSAVAQILNGGRHLLDLINEVLDIARIEAGRMSLSPEVVLASDVIAEAVDLVRPLAAQYGVHWDERVLEKCPDHVFVDRQRTIQILLNLLTNAIKYNSAGGAVGVRCRHEREDEVLIDVTDDGIGIAAEDLPRLFAPFERLGAAATGVEGTGIGLALSRGLAEMMGGRIEVQSTRGVGSTFTVVLPRAEALALPMESATGRPPESRPAGPRRVMYLEDNPANAALMASIVGRRPGVDLEIVTTGAEALASAFATPPQLLLLDLHLPDISGEEVLRRLRTDARTATLPVVILSADAAPDVRARLSLLGADAFLPKPVDVADVLSWVDRPLQGRGAT